MAKREALMTPEQQMMYRKAVNQGVLPRLTSDEYFTMTPEAAAERLQSVAGKVDYNKSIEYSSSASRQTPGERMNPDEPASQLQLRAIKDAIRDKVIDDIPNDEFLNLTKGAAAKIIDEIHRINPPELATADQVKEIERLIKDGRLFDRSNNKITSMTARQADRQIELGQDAEERGERVEGYDPDKIKKRDDPMEAAQELEIKRLVADRRLNPVGRDTWNKMTYGDAGRLIDMGKSREKDDIILTDQYFSRDRSGNFEQDAPGEEESGQEKAPKQVTPSRGNQSKKAGSSDIGF